MSKLGHGTSTYSIEMSSSRGGACRGVMPANLLSKLSTTPSASSRCNVVCPSMSSATLLKKLGMPDTNCTTATLLSRLGLGAACNLPRSCRSCAAAPSASSHCSRKAATRSSRSQVPGTPCIRIAIMLKGAPTPAYASLQRQTGAGYEYLDSVVTRLARRARQASRWLKTALRLSERNMVHPNVMCFGAFTCGLPEMPAVGSWRGYITWRSRVSRAVQPTSSGCKCSFCLDSWGSLESVRVIRLASVIVHNEF